MASSITTHVGDHGQTYTLGGERVFKNDLRVEIPGLSDQLVTHLSFIKLKLTPQDERVATLTWIQTICFVIAANASDPYKKAGFQHQIQDQDIQHLNIMTKQWEEKTIMPKSFIIPGGNELSCLFDIARVFVRNLERSFADFWRTFPEHKIPEVTLALLNRLSDLFYIWARFEEKGNFSVVDYTIIAQHRRSSQ